MNASVLSAPVGGRETPLVQVEYLCQRLREKQYHCMLLPVTTTASTKCKDQGASISASQSRMPQQHANLTTTTTDQFRISKHAVGVHDAAIIATSVRAAILGLEGIRIVCSNASCNDYCIMHSNSTLLILRWLVVVDYKILASHCEMGV